MDIRELIRSTYKGILTLVILAFTAGIIFYLSESRPFFDSLYWSLVTMTTVGYGDIHPTTNVGKAISVILASSGVIIYAYLGSVIISLVVESNLAGVFGLDKCKYEDHFVICGWTKISEIALDELLLEDNQVAVITEEKDEIPDIKRKGSKKKIFPIYGDPSKMEILNQAGVDRANVVILCMDDDSKNLITALHIKDINTDARIIVKTDRSELKETLEIAGVTFVATPFEMSGRLIASAAFEPDVADLVEDITTATNEEGYDLQEFRVKKGKGGTVRKVAGKIRENTSASLVGVSKKKEVKGSIEWKQYPNPDSQLKINPGDAVILLGNDEQLKRASSYLGVKQGR